MPYGFWVTLIVLEARLNIRDSSAIRYQNLMPTDM